MLRKLICLFPFGKSILEDIKIGDEMMYNHVSFKEQFLFALSMIPKIFIFSASISLVWYVIDRICVFLYPYISEFLGWVSAIIIGIIVYLWNKSDTKQNTAISSAFKNVEWLEIATSIVSPITGLSIETLSEYGVISDNYYFFSIEDLRKSDETDLKVYRIKIEKQLVYIYNIELKKIRSYLKTEHPVVKVYPNGIFILPRDFIV